MLKQPIVVRIKRDGPEAIFRKMRERRLYALPVIGNDDQFIGEIQYKDVLKVRQALPVVNEENRLVGVVSPSAIIIEMTGKDQKEIEEIIQNAIDL